jgi:small GTP-binding protein
MKKIVIGILAHVDAGKTTLSESMLYLSGQIRKLGRVDKKDSFLDMHELERQRGITIFSKQAAFQVGDTQFTLLDTPGHVDFSAEMERTLQVLDYAILVISGADGVQAHTSTLWRLLTLHKIPTFVFVNKMDQIGAERESLLVQLKKQLDERCIPFEEAPTASFFEELALCDEGMMHAYLEANRIETGLIKRAIQGRKVFPCFFGSALKLDGVEPFLRSLDLYTTAPVYGKEFGAKVFKISRDDQGNRLTHLKVTGGRLQVKSVLSNGQWEEKINQIRIYSGEKYEVVGEVEPGMICAVTGLTQSKPGEGLGTEKDSSAPVLEPVLSYRVILPEGCDHRAFLPKLQEIEDEHPELRIHWNSELQEIQAQIMGDIQIEILKSLIHTRFDVEVQFDTGRILYKETIANTVEGVGHFEPLRHYAEVHLLLEPGKRGSGLLFASACSEEVLGKNWQNLVLTHLKEKKHIGVLTGSEITDMKITLISGRAHNQHTQGGDFREATYRAVRQGLKEAESILLEPYYSFRLEVPTASVGKAMTDVEQMHGTCEILEHGNEFSVLVGTAPVSTMRNYHREVLAYTNGRGRLFCNLDGYQPCHNAQEVIAEIGYDSESDLENPTGSVFCANGTSFLVSWNEVKTYMHLEPYFKAPHGRGDQSISKSPKKEQDSSTDDDYYYLGLVNPKQATKARELRRRPSREPMKDPLEAVSKEEKPKENYLLVDGYNIIYAWPELREQAENENMEGARMGLLNALSNYQAIKNDHIIVVFDAYRTQRSTEDVVDYGNIRVVFTKEAQTADQYIEKFAYDNQKKYNIKVATSDGLEQIIIRGMGSSLVTPNELKDEIDQTLERSEQAYRDKQGTTRTSLKDALSEQALKHIEGLEESE